MTVPRRCRSVVLFSATVPRAAGNNLPNGSFVVFMSAVLSDGGRSILMYAIEYTLKFKDKPT